MGKSIVFEGKMGMRKFWSVALPFSKVAYAVKGFLNHDANISSNNLKVRRRYQYS